MARQWYAKVMGDVVGPMSPPELSEMIRKGRVGQNDLVSQSKAGPWTEVFAISKELPSVESRVASLPPLAAEQPATPRSWSRVAAYVVGGMFLLGLVGMAIEPKKKKSALEEKRVELQVAAQMEILKSAVTMREYESLAIGMSVEQVNAIIGSKGVPRSSTEHYESYAWDGLDSRSFAICTFHDGRLSSKSQSGLE